MKRALFGMVAAATMGSSSLALAASDFTKQELDIDLVSNPDEVTITANVHVTMTSETTKLYFMATSPALVSAEWNGVPVTVASDFIAGKVVTLPAPVPAGEQGILTVRLAGAPDCSVSGYQVCLRSADRTYLLAPWTGTPWYIISTEQVAYDNHATTIRLYIPSSHKAAALGAVPTIVDQGDGTSIWQFATTFESIEIGFEEGVLEETLTTQTGFPTRALFVSNDTTRAALQQVIDDGSRLAMVYQNLWGDVAVERFDYVTVASNVPFGGTSLTAMITLNEGLLTPTYAFMIPQMNHELSHFWWGSMVTAKADKEYGFFLESFAEYGLWRGMRELYGDATRDSGTRMNAVWYMYRRSASADDPPVLSALGSNEAVFSIYHKGSTIVRTMETAVGTTQFDSVLKTIVAGGKDSASVAGLLSAVQAQSGVDLSSYVPTWLEGTGFPTITANAALTPTGQGYSAVLTATGDNYPMKLPVVWLFADGTRQDATIDFANGAGTLQANIPSWPSAILIDPGWTALKEVHPSVAGDVTFDGRVDGADLIEIGLRSGTFLPTIRRQDGKYDPLYDLNVDRKVDDGDLDQVVQAATQP